MSVFEVSNSELTFEVQAPRVKFTFLRQGETVIRPRSNLFKQFSFTFNQVELRTLSRWFAGNFRVFSDTELAECVCAARKKFWRLREEQREVFTRGHVNEDFFCCTYRLDLEARFWWISSKLSFCSIAPSRTMDVLIYKKLWMIQNVYPDKLAIYLSTSLF